MNAAVDAIELLLQGDLQDDDAVLRSEPSMAAWSEAPLRWLTEPWSAPTAPRERGTRVGPGDVARVRAAIEAFARLDDRFGGGHARQAFVQYLGRDVLPLLKGRRGEAVGEALLGAVAQATLLAAWMTYDACQHGLAQRYFLQALRFAQESGDRRLAGSVLSAMSHQATFLGHAAQAAALARAALLGVSGVATPTLLAQFHATEARALARAGDRTGCERALAASESALDRRAGDDEPEWITYFDESEYAAEAGHCLRDLGRASQAVAHASAAVTGTQARSDFFATMVLADAHLRAGDAEEACGVAAAALDASDHLMSARCVSYLGEFRRSLAEHGLPSATRELAEQAADHPLWIAAGTTADG
jgi:hypothetical protein